MPKKDMKKNEKLELWQGRIATMKTYMEGAGQRKGWSRLIQFYNGDYMSALKLKKNVAVVVINLVNSFVRSALADLFVRTPKFRCNPKQKSGILKARVGEVAINYYWYNKKIKRQVKKCIKEAKLLGYSWVKVGYEGTIGSYGDEENNEFVKNEDIFAVYCKHDAVWYDPLSQDPPFDCGWMIHTYLRQTDKLNEKYTDLKIVPTSKNLYGNAKDNLLKSKDTEMSRIFEIWDKENDEILLLTDGYKDGFLEEKPWSKTYDDPTFPFSMLYFDTMIDFGDEAKDNLPEPEINTFLDLILEKAKFRSLQISHIKRFSRQMFMKEDAMEESEEKKFSDGLDGAIIKVKGDPGSIMKSADYPPIQPDIYAVENKIDMDMDRVSGRPAFMQGVAAQTKTRTLGEMEMMQSGANSRLLEEQDTVEEFTEEIARKILNKMRQFFNKDMYARIVSDVSPLDKQLFSEKGLLDGTAVKYNNELLPNEEEGDIEIVAGSTLPMSPQTRMNNLVNLAKVGQAFGLMPGSLASMYLGQAMMQEFELNDVEKAYDKDIENALKPKQPSPKEQLEMIGKKQAVDKAAVDTQLKRTRNEGQQLANVKKALDNSKALNGEDDKKPAKPSKPEGKKQ